MGGFFTDEDFTGGQFVLPVTVAGQPAPNDIHTYELPTRFKELAAFANLDSTSRQARTVGGHPLCP